MGVRDIRESAKALSESVKNFPFPHFAGVLLTAGYIRPTHLRINQLGDLRLTEKINLLPWENQVTYEENKAFLAPTVSGATEAGTHGGHE